MSSCESWSLFLRFSAVGETVGLLCSETLAWTLALGLRAITIPFSEGRLVAVVENENCFALVAAYTG